MNYMAKTIRGEYKDAKRIFAKNKYYTGAVVYDELSAGIGSGIKWWQ